MTELSSQALLTQVDRFAQGDSGQILVAFSGGLDSTVLLYALADALGPNRERLCAVHVNHGLHANSDQWETQCKQVALRLNIAYVSRRVSVPEDGAHGIEASARTLRYDALRDLVLRDGLLLTAHHADDQLETMLLALVRGSGVDGLASMPSIQRFGRGWHVRPLLDFTRDDLLRFATARDLAWLEDPSNAFVVARINPLRWIKDEPPPLDEVMKTMRERAARFNIEKVKPQDVARSGGAPEES